MNGQLTVESAPGEGSTFCFTAHFGRAKSEGRSEVAVAPALLAQRRMRILVADDNEINRSVATRMLRRKGHRVQTAVNGREAVQAYGREVFDLILMDVQMPELDGFDATAQIRALEKQTGRRVGIVAMTAHAMTGDRERCLAAGMDGYVAKPVDKGRVVCCSDKVREWRASGGWRIFRSRNACSQSDRLAPRGGEAGFANEK
jgi:two-component system, sensor histidine kinase and response regulator